MVFTKHPDDEPIAGLQLVKPVEKPGRRQAGVSGEDGMRGFAADGKAAFYDMPCSPGQTRVNGTVEDGQVNADFRDDQFPPSPRLH